MTTPVDVLEVLNCVVLGEISQIESQDEFDRSVEAVANLIEAAERVAGVGVGIAPRDRKLHALRAALAGCKGSQP